MHDLHGLFDQVMRYHFGDARVTYADLHLAVEDNAARVTGYLLNQSAAVMLLSDLRTQAPAIDWHDGTTPLVGGTDYRWTLADRAVVDVRRHPDDDAERVTQVLWGEQCEILRVSGNWLLVRTGDGYLGWAHREPFATCEEQIFAHVGKQRTHVIAARHAPVFASPDLNPSDQITLLPFGVRVTVAQEQRYSAAIHWIDSSMHWIDRSVLHPLAGIPQRTPDGLQLVTDWLPRLLGVPYLWGGKTPFGYDCSGLVQIIYDLIGVPLPRDADQQCAVGETTSLSDMRLGDLLFFDSTTPVAEPSTHGASVSHVALALDQHRFIHASRRGGGVGWGSFNAASPHYLAGMERRLVAARRYL